MSRKMLKVGLAATVAAVLGWVAPAFAQEAIKIGFLGAISGPAADLGRPSRDGALLKIEEINKAGGINGRLLELVVYDDESNPAKAVAAVRRMAESDDVVAVVSGTTTGSTLAALKITQEIELPHVVVVAQAPIVTRPVNPWTFRVTGNFDHEITRIAAFLKSEGVKKLALLKDSGTVGQEAYASLKPKLDELGIELVANEDVVINATDVTAQTLNIRRAEPDAVVYYGYGAEAALFAKTMQQVGLDAKVIGNRGLAMPVFLETGGDAVDGFVITDNFTATKQVAADFAAHFKEAKGYEVINAFPGLGYDGIGVLAQALSKAETVDRPSVRDALEKVEGYEAVTGGNGMQISFSAEKHDGPTGDIEQIVVMRKAEGGKYVDQ